MIAAQQAGSMARTTITLSSRNYSSWSLRGWLMAKQSGVPFTEIMVAPDDLDARAEILLLSPSILVPCLEYEGIKIWDTIAPKSGLLPKDRAKRAHCRSISGEMHSGFSALRSALPMNLRARFPNFKVWSKADADIARIATIWNECLRAYGGPFLFGEFSMADAMYAPVATRFVTYDVKLDAACAGYRDRVLAWPAMQEWTDTALEEPEEIEELEVEF